MPRQREPELFGANSMPVVRDAQQARAAGLYFDVDVRCTRVQRVFDELLHDRGGPLDDFAGCDLVDQVRGQDFDGHAGIVDVLRGAGKSGAYCRGDQPRGIVNT